MTTASPRQLLNTSWTAHRLSPLHHEKEFQTLLNNPDALNTYASRLRDQLTGNIFGGLQSGLSAGGEDDSFSKTGALRSCSWEMLSSWAELTDDNAVSTVPRPSAGVLVTLEYEKVVYKAALLSNDDTEQTESSTSLPLLLTRLPNPLRQTFVSFLSANFDTYCSILRLPQAFLCSALEVYFNPFIPSGSSDDDQNLNILADVVKELHLTLSFSPSIAPNLRSLNISIPRTTFMAFVTSSPSTEHPENALLANLSSYLDKHLAMNLELNNPSAHTLAKQHARLSKVSSGAFGIGCEGKLKLVVPEGNTATGDSAENGTQTRSEKEKLSLRASVALLQAVIRRATPGQSQGS
ncbi:hypothetical protein PHISCL_06210 [Aspergillus sclerotialis]|uniref:Kinetochore complex Sim4 subunit Fta1-domain-containing protein n=1 Tax=Aspergillus sclerotialis TaxID=2070753 RepID=A0A3A2ZES3_9EURO|nr:hypothetical protein PHISCL_06210 [Aspergillus sclerotialis]